MATNTMVKQFKVVKYLGKGAYSKVFEVISQDVNTDIDKRYAVKKYFLETVIAMKRAIREHHILRRLTTEITQSSFFPNMSYSTLFYGFPLIFMTKASDINLFHVLKCFSRLLLEDAKFYCCEVLCGLKQLHALGIVHLDIKPENILIAESGHIMISDFDCAYDMISNLGPPRAEDYMGTPLYMAPEITTRRLIAFETDIWNVGSMMLRMVPGDIRRYFDGDFPQPFRCRYTVTGLGQNSQALESFFNACLAYEPSNRPTVENIRQLEFFADVNWEAVASLSQPPPFTPTYLRKEFEEIGIMPHPATVGGASSIHNGFPFDSIDLQIGISEETYLVNATSDNFDDFHGKRLSRETCEGLRRIFNLINEKEVNITKNNNNSRGRQ